MAAGDADTSVAALEGCNPLGQEWDCLLPYPSDAFLIDGQVSLSDAALPKDKFGDPIRAFDAREANGFSVHPSILFTLGSGIDPNSLVGQDRTELSVMVDSPTVLLDTESGDPVPHFSEVYLGADEELQIGAIRPLVRLADGRRYVVAVKNVRLADGSDAEPPEVFAALRDAVVGAEHVDLLSRFETDVFAPLDAFGVDRSELDLAWDFTTRTREDLTGDMISVRAGTLAWLESNTPTVTLGEVREGEDVSTNIAEHTFRHIEGTFTAPLWTESDEPGAVLRGPVGQREIVGTIEVPFTITIPHSIAEDEMRTGSFIQYGHGFFGRRDEVTSFVQAKFGDDYGYVMGAVEWAGMTRADRDWVVGQIGGGAAAAFQFVPRVHQGMSNQLVFTEVVRGVLANEAALKVGTRPVYEPDQIYFLGISQGHILGGTFMALSPTIERAVLNVGGASFGLILTRSYAFLLYERLLAQWMGTLELLKFESVATQVLEVIDPIAYAPLVLEEPLPGAVTKQVLLQGGMGDAAVPSVAIELHARALGIGLLSPSSANIPFIESVSAPADSALSMFDFGIDPAFGRPWDPINMDNEAHEGVRRFGAAREQMQQFLRPNGQVEDTCAGPCVVP